MLKSPRLLFVLVYLVKDDRAMLVYLNITSLTLPGIAVRATVSAQPGAGQVHFVDWDVFVEREEGTEHASLAAYSNPITEEHLTLETIHKVRDILFRLTGQPEV
jgi:hypothetical protein